MPDPTPILQAFDACFTASPVPPTSGNLGAAVIRAAAEQCIAIPGHHPASEWLAGYQAARRSTYEQLHKLAAALEGHP